MKFDTVIIGGGLSALTCGIRLLQQGQRCAIVSSGQSALHFFSGSFDLLNVLPEGGSVTNPTESVKDLIRMRPNHPYAKLGEHRFCELAGESESFLSGIGLSFQGSAAKNHYRITPMGILKPTWLSASGFAVSQSDSKLPWKKVSIFNISGFLDFYPQFLAGEFAGMGTENDIRLFSLPDLDNLRRNPSEVRSTNIAKILDKESNKDQLTSILSKGAADSEAIILPACAGLENTNTLAELRKAINKPIYLIPTLPPSVIGIHTQRYMHNYFVRLGGVYMLGDTVQRADIENRRVTKVYSYNHGDIPFIAGNIVLATGSYFSQGLIATTTRVYEPVFDLDVAYAPSREDWHSPNMFDSQNYQEFGVKTNESFNALLGGKILENLYVAGAVLEGFNPIKEGSGAGVSILSALHIADQIISKEGGQL